MMAADVTSAGSTVFKLHPLENMNLCSTLHGCPSKSVSNISVWAKVTRSEHSSTMTAFRTDDQKYDDKYWPVHELGSCCMVADLADI